MSHQTTAAAAAAAAATAAFTSEKSHVLQGVLRRDIEHTGRFSPESTAEEVAEELSNDIRGKTIIITGASPSGLGAEAARVVFLHNPKLLILAGRSKRAIDETIIAIGGKASSENIRAVVLDLADLESVRKAAAEILEITPTVDVLINNAGVMMVPGFTKTKQGVELQFQVNHLGHFLLTNLLAQALLRSSFGPSVVNIASAGHRAGGVRFDDINFEDGATYEPFAAYGQSKTANILFTISLHQKLRKKGLRSFAVDPGSVGTTNLNKTIPFETRVKLGWWNADGSLSDGIPWTSVGHGASSYIVGAFDRTIDGESGKCLAKANLDPTSEPYATDPELAERLWLLSEKLAGQEFRYD